MTRTTFVAVSCLIGFLIGQALWWAIAAFVSGYPNPMDWYWYSRLAWVLVGIILGVLAGCVGGSLAEAIDDDWQREGRP